MPTSLGPVGRLRFVALLALGCALAVTPVVRPQREADPAASVNGHRREPVVAGRPVP